MMTPLLTLFVPLLLLAASGALLGQWALLPRLKGAAEAEPSLVRFGLWIAGGLFAWLLALSLWQGLPTVVTPGQLAATMAALAWLGHVYVQHRVRQRLLTVLPLGTVVVLLVAALTLGLQPSATPSETLIQPRALAHIALSLASITLLLGSGVFGAGEVILHRQLSNRTFGRWFHNLPSLREMAELRRVTVVTGWLLVTFSLLSALVSLWLMPESRAATASHMHPMLLFWGVVTLLSMATQFRWLAQRTMAMASLGMSAVMLILIVISVVAFFTRGHA